MTEIKKIGLSVNGKTIKSPVCAQHKPKTGGTEQIQDASESSNTGSKRGGARSASLRRQVDARGVAVPCRGRPINIRSAHAEAPGKAKRL